MFSLTVVHDAGGYAQEIGAEHKKLKISEWEIWSTDMRKDGYREVVAASLPKNYFSFCCGTSISAPSRRYTWGLYNGEKRKIKGRKKLTSRKKIGTKIFLTRMLSLYNVSTMASWLLSRYQPKTNNKLKL